MVHNGIIENYRILKDALTAHGYTFRSTTDSEVFVNLIEYIRTSNNCTLLEAVQQAIKQVVGAYAIAVVDRDDPDQLIAVRQSSPLVVGIGDNEYFISSDAASVIEYTNDFVYLNQTTSNIQKRMCEKQKKRIKVMFILKNRSIIPADFVVS